MRPRSSDGTSAPSLFFSFLRLGLTAFGGPAMIPYIRELAVRRRGWLDEASFNDGLVLAQSLPGATAMQCVAYVGLQVRGVGGALLAYVAFGLPAFLLLLVLSVAYAATRDVTGVVNLLVGLQVIVVAIVAAATVVLLPVGIDARVVRRGGERHPPRLDDVDFDDHRSTSRSSIGRPSGRGRPARCGDSSGHGRAGS